MLWDCTGWIGCSIIQQRDADKGLQEGDKLSGLVLVCLPLLTRLLLLCLCRRQQIDACLVARPRQVPVQSCAGQGTGQIDTSGGFLTFL